MSQSSYLPDYDLNPEGLGRAMSIRPRLRSELDVDRISRTRETITDRIRNTAVLPRPVPVSVNCNDYKGKPNAQKPPQCRSAGNMQTTNTKSGNSSSDKQANNSGTGTGFLDGTFTVGGMEIKKSHAAVGGAAAFGGLLLLAVAV